MASLKKIAQVQSIDQSLKQTKNFVLLKYSEVPTQLFDGLRKSLKKANSALSVVKNSLFEKAINILSSNDKLFKNLKKNFFPLKESTLIIYLGEDWSRSLKQFSDFSANKKNFTFKFGILDQIIYDSAQLTKIAQLPAKDQLIAKIIGGLTNPARRFTLATKFNINKFVYILKQKSQSRG